MTSPTSVVFAYHNVGVRCLRVLLDQGVHVPLVLTHEDSPTENIWYDSVAQVCADNGIEAITVDDANHPGIVARIRALAPDFLFSFYYRLMLKRDMLLTASRGAYNMHGSLLPKYRGRVPVNWAIIHGETETGATLHYMTEKPDNGDIVAQQRVPILPDDTAQEVFDKVTVAAELALYDVLPALIAGTAPRIAQDLSLGRYLGGRKPEDGRIDWTRSARDVHNLVRAVAPPYPGAFSDTSLGRLVINRTRVIEESASHGSARPQLAAIDSRLCVDCGRGTLLILDATLNGEGSVASIVSRLGASRVPLH